uniref:Uncharacterized protein LOC117354454 isoform X3 n=1 Tax=Geotrypetes seraphini TaxID=260995 RepID=A0A6P8QMH5_GEOSA|nr:uncharacterized protein LOC117354454 isoform X3 [Geotrypetes seraphini]
MMKDNSETPFFLGEQGSGPIWRDFTEVALQGPRARAVVSERTANSVAADPEVLFRIKEEDQPLCNDHPVFIGKDNNPSTSMVRPDISSVFSVIIKEEDEEPYAIARPERREIPITKRHLKGDKAFDMAARTREENFSLEEKVLLARLVLAKESILFPPGRGRGSILARRKAWSDIRCTIYREIGTWREIESIKAKYRALRRQDVSLLAQLRRESHPLLGAYHPGMHNQQLVRGDQVVVLNDDEELEAQELEEENEEEEDIQEAEEEQLDPAAVPVAPVAAPAGPPLSADPSPTIAESAPPVEPLDQSVSQTLLKTLQGLTDSNIALMREVTMLRSCMAGLVRVVEGQRPSSLIQEIEGMRVELRALTEAIRQQGACGSLPFDPQV